jgi:ATP-dependent DNA helicase RecQ
MLRKKIADENNWPPYVVFNDTALKEMSKTRPRTAQEFSGIPGVGKKKRDRYSREFIGAINEYADGVCSDQAT